MHILAELIEKNSLVMSFLFVGIVLLISDLLAKHLFRGRLRPSAIAIFIALAAAYIGGRLTGGQKGISDLALFSGVGLLGSSMFRDFTIVSTAFGADLKELKRCGKAGVIALIGGVALSYCIGMLLSVVWGYRDAREIAVIASGTVTFIVGPVTASALGVTSGVVAISIAAGVVKSIVIMVATPLIAGRVGLTTPKAAMIYGAMMGSTSGVSAGLAATDQRLVPYGAMMATFYMGTGCLLCPTVLYGLTQILFR